MPSINLLFSRLRERGGIHGSLEQEKRYTVPIHSRHVPNGGSGHLRTMGCIRCLRVRLPTLHVPVLVAVGAVVLVVEFAAN